MCTVVCRWSPGEPLRMLALRDEFVGREFDGPGRWWPEHPHVVGGRDRRAGGTWCACDVPAGTTAVVLNRPDRLQAEPGAASRGVLPLLAVQHGAAWTEHVDTTPMASFNLLLATPDLLTWWTFDGTSLHEAALPAGVHLAKPRGLVETFDERLGDPRLWPDMLARSIPGDDPSGLLVRVKHGDAVYATVFGQLIEQAPGRLRIDHSRTPGRPDTFVTERWT